MLKGEKSIRKIISKLTTVASLSGTRVSTLGCVYGSFSVHRCVSANWQLGIFYLFTPSLIRNERESSKESAYSASSSTKQKAALSISCRCSLLRSAVYIYGKQNKQEKKMYKQQRKERQERKFEKLVAVTVMVSTAVVTILPMMRVT